MTKKKPIKSQAKSPAKIARPASSQRAMHYALSPEAAHAIVEQLKSELRACAPTYAVGASSPVSAAVSAGADAQRQTVNLTADSREVDAEIDRCYGAMHCLVDTVESLCSRLSPVLCGGAVPPSSAEKAGEPLMKTVYGLRLRTHSSSLYALNGKLSDLLSALEV